MSDQIEKVNNTTTSVSYDLQKVSSSVVANATDYTERIFDKVLHERPTFLQRLIPDPVRRAKISGEMRLVQDKFEFLSKTLATVNEMQLQTLQEACNSYLVQMKAANRANIHKFLASRSVELAREVDDIFEEYVLSIDQKLQTAESLRSEKLRETRIKYLEGEFEEFIALQKTLIHEFNGIVSEKIKRQV